MNNETIAFILPPHFVKVNRVRNSQQRVMIDSLLVEACGAQVWNRVKKAFLSVVLVEYTA